MRVGLVGWRGMVGSVLMQRMVEENDFAHFEPYYFTTSSVGGASPSFGGKTAPALMDAKDIDALKSMDVQLRLFKFLRSPLHETLSLTLKSIHLLIILGIFLKVVEPHLVLFAHSKIRIYLKVRSTTNSFMSKKLHFHLKSTQLRVVC
jgi:hypothetical protein